MSRLGPWVGEATSAQDLRCFVREYLEQAPEDVVVLEDAIDMDQEVTALVTELERHGSPLLICTNVQGLPVPMPIVTNLFGSRKRIARMLGTTLPDLHKAFMLASARKMPPKVVATGPVLDHVEEGSQLDLHRLPMLKHFAEDRAPYLTSAIVIAESPATGIANASYHRCMVDSATTLATSLHSRGDLWRYLNMAAEAGTVLPVAVVLGGHPLFMLASSARVGIDVDEREIAGGLFGEPLEVVPTPRYRLGVPSTAEIVLEGVIDPARQAEEGPFGEFSGYATSRSTHNVIEVSAVLSRDNPGLIDVVSGDAPDHLNLGRVPRESEMAARLMERFPDVVSIEYPASGTHFHCYVGIRQSMPGMAKQVALALLGWDPYIKLVVVVDDDIALTHDGDVLWAMATRFQGDRDLIVVGGLPGSMLDPSSAGGATARVGIDATRSPGFTAERISLSKDAQSHARQLLGAVLSRQRRA